MPTRKQHTHGPVRIWATVNGWRITSPSESHRIGEWEERDVALHPIEYVRADIVGELVEALISARGAIALSDISWGADGPGAVIKHIDAALSRATSEQPDTSTEPRP